MQWGLSGAANQSKLMRLVNGDMVRYQGLSTTGWTVCNLLNLFLAPVTAALSDTFGRIPFMAQGRLAIMGAAQKRPLPPSVVLIPRAGCRLQGSSSATATARPSAPG